MPKRLALPGLRNAMKKMVTLPELFLAEQYTVVPGARLLGLIAPHYPKDGAKSGRPPMSLETMPRAYFLQHWYALINPLVEETLYDSKAMRCFAGVKLGDDRIPDEAVIFNFRHLLERCALSATTFAKINAKLADNSTTVRSGTLSDATIIDALRSTKNKMGDLEMSSTKKGNDWYLGVKAHIGVDAESGVTHSLEISTAKLHPMEKCANRVIAKVRAKIEHLVRVIKRQFNHVKTRYCSLAKNRAQPFTPFAPGSLFLVRKRLMA
jgi:IS5 family transposase